MSPTDPAATTGHGYLAYAYGCRCEACRTAKALYMRTKRAAARVLREAAKAAGEVYVAEGIRHGYSGYQDYGCRCTACWRARKGADARRYRERAVSR